MKIFTRDNSRFSLWFFREKIEVVSDGQTVKILVPPTVAKSGCGICRNPDGHGTCPDRPGSTWVISNKVAGLGLGAEAPEADCSFERVDSLKKIVVRG